LTTGNGGYKQREYPMTAGQLPFSVPFDTEKFKYVTLKMVVESGAHILFHTYFADVIKEMTENVKALGPQRSLKRVDFDE